VEIKAADSYVSLNKYWRLFGKDVTDVEYCNEEVGRPHSENFWKIFVRGASQDIKMLKIQASDNYYDIGLLLPKLSRLKQLFISSISKNWPQLRQLLAGPNQVEVLGIAWIHMIPNNENIFNVLQNMTQLKKLFINYDREQFDGIETSNITHLEVMVYRPHQIQLSTILLQLTKMPHLETLALSNKFCGRLSSIFPQGRIGPVTLSSLRTLVLKNFVLDADFIKQLFGIGSMLRLIHIHGCKQFHGNCLCPLFRNNEFVMPNNNVTLTKDPCRMCRPCDILSRCEEVCQTSSQKW